jgi:uncharacterized protein YjiS (DUF1127 family)
MSTLRQRRAAPRHPGLARGTAPTSRLLATLREWRRRLAGRAALRQMSPRQLRDLGITAAEVARECAKPFWRG